MRAIIVGCAIVFSASVGFAAHVAADSNPPPPKASIQEPTDWTPINRGPDSVSDMHVRTIIVQGHECVLVEMDGNSGRGGVSISCDFKRG